MHENISLMVSISLEGILQFELPDSIAAHCDRRARAGTDFVSHARGAASMKLKYAVDGPVS
jgi:hypothetical protein